MDPPGVRLQVYTAILLENPYGPFSGRAVGGVRFGRYPEPIDIEVPSQEQPRRPSQSTKEGEATARALRASVDGDLGVLEENKLTWNTRATFSEHPGHGYSFSVQF